MKKWISAFLCASLLGTGILGVSGCSATGGKRQLDGATLVTFGDSLTALSTWPMDTAKALNMHLVNSGIGANTTAHAVERFEQDVAAHDPDFVIICFGTNDFYRQNGIIPKVTPAKYRENLLDIASRVRDLDAVPVFMTPPFIAESASGGAGNYPGTVNEALDEYVDIMREVAAETQADLIDIHEVCDNGQTVPTFLVADGVHLSALGAGVVTDEIVAYMTEHYRQNKLAKQVEQPVAPKAEEGAWTKSIVPTTADGWRAIYPDTASVSEQDGAVVFTNLNGGWPEIHYSPLLPDTLAAPVAGTTLTVDVELDAASNILLFFGGATPTLAYTNHYVSLTTPLKAADPTLQSAGDDLLGGQHVKVTLPLEDVVPSAYRNDDGTALFSGVKVFVSGAPGQTVTVHEMTVTTKG